MARIRATSFTERLWYLERGMGPSYVWTPDESQATDMPRKYAAHRADELARVERYRDCDVNERREIKVVRSKFS